MFRRAGTELGPTHQVEAGDSRPGGRWWNFGASLESTPEKIEKFFPLIFFRYFVSEMVLTCLVSICIISKYGNGEFFTQSEEENGSSPTFEVNRTRRRKKFLELAIWEVFYRRKRGLMNVDKQHILQQLCSVSVDFQQLEGSISLLKKT